MIKIDNIDRKILNQLEQDGRISYAALAKEVGLTSTSVGQRVQRMVEDGVILGFGAHLDKEKLGISIQALVSLKLNFARIESFHKVLKTYDEIEYCYRVTGEDCMIMKVNLSNNKHLLEFINRISIYGLTTTNVIIEQLV
ncbi:MAG: Lrp/AsnC family transcriptional regulator [Bacteroidota bacterium]